MLTRWGSYYKVEKQYFNLKGIDDYSKRYSTPLQPCMGVDDLCWLKIRFYSIDLD
jgi:hypothetical protein